MVSCFNISYVIVMMMMMIMMMMMMFTDIQCI